MGHNGDFFGTQATRDALERCGAVTFDAPMADVTTFRTGGPADALLSPRSAPALGDAIAIARDARIPLTIIGGGSNLLVGDRGIRGLVIRIATPTDAAAPLGAMRSGRDDMVYAGAGVRKEDFIRFAIDAGYGGVEFMAGIPGCMGGGIVMNAGTNMGTFVDILRSIECVDDAGELRSLEVTREMSSYRRFDIPPGWVVVGGYFQLPRASSTETVRNRVQTILAERAQKHPIAYPCAGSVFKNPAGHAAWRLINDAGLKGHRIGGAMVSELHTNFIINCERAAACDVRALVLLVQERVKERFGIELETEIKMIGEF